MSAWIDIVRGGNDFRTPVLQEFHQPYQSFDNRPDGQAKLLLLFCTGGCSGAEAPRQVRMCRFAKTILLDCHLHHQKSYPAMKAGPCPPNLTRRQVESYGCPEDLAHEFYARALSPLCEAVVFIQNDYWDILTIVGVLARWVDLSLASSIRCRPQVLIVSEHEPKIAPRDVERDLAAELMSHYSPLEGLSFSQAEKRWRSCFAGIRLMRGCRSRTSADHVLEWTQATRNNDTALTFRSCDVKHLLRSTCSQFAEDHRKTFSFQQAWRTNPLPGQLSWGAEKLVRLTMHDATLYESACSAIANSLLLETYQHRRRVGRILNPKLMELSSTDWFDEFYSPMLSSIEPVTLKADVRTLFVQFMKAEPSERQTLLASSMRTLSSSSKITLPTDLCVVCLCRFPATTLSCGHRVCDDCTETNGKKSEEGIDIYQMHFCVLCGAVNSVQTALKPPSAGIRVLNLHGNVDDALPIAMFLKDLRSSLSGRLEDYFDLVLGSGIGAFFMVMIFCNQATVEDCIYHLPKLKCVRIDDKSLFFGKGLRFPRSDLLDAKIKLVLYNTDSRLAICQNYITKSSKWLQKFSILFQGVDNIAARAFIEANRIWPDGHIDVITQCHNSNYPETLSMANELISALFYVQREGIPTFYDLFPARFVLWVKCRLPAGRHLLDIAMRMRRRRVHIQFHESGQVRYFLLCTDQILEGLKNGRPLLRRLEVLLHSPRSIITVKLNGTLATGTRELCSCPTDLLPCLDANDHPKSSLKEQIDNLQETVARLV